MVGELRRIGSFSLKAMGLMMPPMRRPMNMRGGRRSPQASSMPMVQVSHGLGWGHLAPETRAVRTKIRHPLFELLNGLGLPKGFHGLSVGGVMIALFQFSRRLVASGGHPPVCLRAIPLTLTYWQ